MSLTVVIGQYEFEFESQTSAKATAALEEPRIAQTSSDSIPEDVYPASPNYVLSSDPTGDITRDLAQISLIPATSSFPLRDRTSVPTSEQTHITTFDPYTNKEEFDPRKRGLYLIGSLADDAQITRFTNNSNSSRVEYVNQISFAIFH